MCVGSRVHLVGVSISFEKNFYRLPFTPPLWFAVSVLQLSALCSHPRHCSATPGTAMTSPTLLKRTGTGRRHARHCSSYGHPSTPPSSRPADGGWAANLCTTTLEAAPVWPQDSPRHPNRSEIHQDGRQLRGTARHAFTRRRTVRHACKLLSPCSIKGGAVPQPQGGDDG
jgi:hypothetical protein